MKKVISSILAIVMLFACAAAVAEETVFVTFGSYEQDNNPDNGSEPIEWVVLETEEDRALLLSRYGLDAKPYNTDYVDVTWETCSLRAWLNGEFLAAAFSAEEQDAILMTTVDNSDSQCYDFTADYDYAENVTGGNDTEDKIFLLSYAEAYKYYAVTYRNDRNKEARMAPTDYAKQQGASTNTKNKTADKKNAGWWWLRSPGTVQSYAARVGYDGSLSLDCVHKSVTCVRPAIWVNIDAIGF